SALACPNQQLPRAQGKNRRDGAVFRIVRTNLAKTPSIEGKHAVRRAYQEQLRLPRIGQQPNRDAQQRTGGKFLAGAVVFDLFAAPVIFEKARRPADKQASLKDSRPGKCGRSADPGKSIAGRRLQPDQGKTMLRLGFDLLPRSL